MRRRLAELRRLTAAERRALLLAWALLLLAPLLLRLRPLPRLLRPTHAGRPLLAASGAEAYAPMLALVAEPLQGPLR